MVTVRSPTGKLIHLLRTHFRRVEVGRVTGSSGSVRHSEVPHPSTLGCWVLYRRKTGTIVPGQRYSTTNYRSIHTGRIIITPTEISITEVLFTIVTRLKRYKIYFVFIFCFFFFSFFRFTVSVRTTVCVDVSLSNLLIWTFTELFWKFEKDFSFMSKQRPQSRLRNWSIKIHRHRAFFTVTVKPWGRLENLISDYVDVENRINFLKFPSYLLFWVVRIGLKGSLVSDSVSERKILIDSYTRIHRSHVPSPH